MTPTTSCYAVKGPFSLPYCRILLTLKSCSTFCFFSAAVSALATQKECGNMDGGVRLPYARIYATKKEKIFSHITQSRTKYLIEKSRWRVTHRELKLNCKKLFSAIKNFSLSLFLPISLSLLLIEKK